MFLPWIEAEFGMSRQTAERFLNVANVYGAKVLSVSNLNLTALYELAAPSTPPEVRELIDKATDIRLRAEIRAGELLREMPKNEGTRGTGDANIGRKTGGRDERPPVDTTNKTLKDLGITKTQSAQWQIGHRANALGFNDSRRLKAELLLGPLPETTNPVSSFLWAAIFGCPLHLRQRPSQFPARHRPFVSAISAHQTPARSQNASAGFSGDLNCGHCCGHLMACITAQLYDAPHVSRSASLSRRLRLWYPRMRVEESIDGRNNCCQ